MACAGAHLRRQHERIESDFRRNQRHAGRNVLRPGEHKPGGAVVELGAYRDELLRWERRVQFYKFERRPGPILSAATAVRCAKKSKNGKF